MRESKISKATEGILSRFRSLDGAVVGKDLQSFKLRLGKDEKGAMVNDIVDKYMKKELTDEYLQQVKKKHGIRSIEIVREIVKREIGKVMRI